MKFDYDFILQEANVDDLSAYSDSINVKLKWVRSIYEGIQKQIKTQCSDRHLSKLKFGHLSGGSVKEFLTILGSVGTYRYKTIRDTIIPCLKKIFQEQNIYATDSEQTEFNLELKKGFQFVKKNLEGKHQMKKKFQFFGKILEEIVISYPPGKKYYHRNLAIITLGYESGVRACAVAALTLRDITLFKLTKESKAYGEIIVQLNFRKEKGYYEEKPKNFFGYLTRENQKIADPVYFLLQHLYEKFNFKKMEIKNGAIVNNIVDQIERLSNEDQKQRIFNLDLKEYSKMTKKAALIAGYDCPNITYHALRHSISVNGTIKELKGELVVGATKHYVGHSPTSSVHEHVYLGRLDQCINGSAIATETKEGQEAGTIPMVPELMDVRGFNGIKGDILAKEPLKIKRETLAFLYAAIHPYSIRSIKKRTGLYHRIALSIEQRKWPMNELNDGTLTDFICLAVCKMSKQEQTDWISKTVLPMIKEYFKS